MKTSSKLVAIFLMALSIITQIANAQTIAKVTGAAVNAPTYIVGNKDVNKITITASSSILTNGQTIEYAINTDNSAPTTGWQDGLEFTGLSGGTTYYFFARSKESDYYLAGNPSTDLKVTTKIDGLRHLFFEIFVANTDVSENSFDLATTLNKTPEETGPMTVTDGLFPPFIDHDKILKEKPTFSGSTITYTGTGKSSGFARLFLIIKSENYTDMEFLLHFETTDKKAVTITLTAQPSCTYTPGTPCKGYTDTPTSGAYTGELEYNYYIFLRNFNRIPGAPTDPGDYYLLVRVPNYNPSYVGSKLVRFTIEKATGAAVATPTLASKTNNSITITASTVPSTGQTVEYGISTSNTTEPTTWISTLTFSGLSASTDYYVWARSASNDYYVQGTAVASEKITTNASSSSGSGSGGCETSCSGYKPTPVLSKVETGNKAVHIANGLSLSVSSGAAVGIYGLKGNLVQSQSYASGEHTMSLNNLPKGMYIVKVSFRNKENTISHSDVMKVTIK
jgi:hypothetical protein